MLNNISKIEMVSLTKPTTPEEIAEAFAKKELLNLHNGIFLVHSAAVKFVSLTLAKEEEDKEILIVASWLHNIGKARDDKHHDLCGYELAKPLFKNKSSDFYYKLCDCILNHRAAKKPETKEGKIIHDADKIAFIHQTYLDFVKAEMDREDKSEEFKKFVETKLKFKEELILEESKVLFEEYAELIKI